MKKKYENKDLNIVHDDGYYEAKEEFKEKLEQLKKKPQKVSSFCQDKLDYNKIKEMIYCNYCGKESKGGILYQDGPFSICNECKKIEEIKL